MNDYSETNVPTFYFIGVTTAQSSIMKVFPKWAKELGLKNAIIKGIDFKPHSSAAEYREAVAFIKHDPMSLGALVTTHKLDLFKSCEDLFDYIDPFAKQLGEVSCISKNGKNLCAFAKDPISSGLALENFVPNNYWKEYGGDILLMGAGGSSLAMSVYFCQKKFGDNVPRRIMIANRSFPRLEEAKKILCGINDKVKFEFIHNPLPQDNDATLCSLKPHSLIVNATGLGKDGPGSPITDSAIFPEDSLVWEINYRGDLVFKDQAMGQKEKRRLYIEDGWIYFIHGWTQVIEEVFHIPIEDEVLQKLSNIAR
ncbi:MAG: shikimate dehydrogenase [Anaerocolumna sp.]